MFTWFELFSTYSTGVNLKLDFPRLVVIGDQSCEYWILTLYSPTY